MTVSADLACRICGNIKQNTRHSAREMMFGLREKFGYIECSNCGCLQIEEVPQDLSPYYPSNYYSFTEAAADWKPPAKFRSLLRKKHAERELGRPNIIGSLTARRFPHWEIPPWLKEIRLPFTSSILDVGSGSGNVLLTLSELGYENLTGVDPFVDHDIAYSNGVRILKRNLADIQGSFDCILLNHSFEHMADPQDCLVYIRERLKLGGIAVIRIPVSHCEAWRIYGIDWVQLDAPRHLYLHNEQSMSLLAQNAGLVIDRVVYDSRSFQFTASEGYRRDIPLVDQNPSTQFTKQEIEEFDRKSLALNARKQGDQATFYLKRICDGSE
jgi:SAM-dependent methyltransferase